MSVRIRYFVHGTTVDNEAHKAAGWNDVELSQKGIDRVKALRDAINIDDIDVVISSDLTRAVDTANYVFNGKEILHDERIRECNYGVLNGEDSSLVVYEEHIKEAFDGGESLLDVEARMRDFCKFLKDYYDGKTVALVAHKAPQLALEVITKGKTWKEAIESDWRKTKAWQPGWEYELK